VTVRCNNRDFDLRSKEARMFVLHALAKAMPRFNGRLYGVALMSNHVHYLLETNDPDDMPRLMHWLNWYIAIGLNRLLKRTGHFWEARYHAVAVKNDDHRHVMNVLRYIHGNPLAAGVRKGFRDEFSNYGSYASGRDDGLTSWHPQYLRLGGSLEECASRYQQFCLRYRPSPKPDITSVGWGRRTVLRGLASELHRKATYGRKKRAQDQVELFEGDGAQGGSSIRDDGPGHQREASRAVAWSRVPGTDGARGGSPWLIDTIRSLFRTFRVVNAPGRRYPRDVPWRSVVRN
jgi:putative transposase